MNVCFQAQRGDEPTPWGSPADVRLLASSTSRGQLLTKLCTKEKRKLRFSCFIKLWTEEW